MHLKIYFNNAPLFLCDTIDAAIEPFRHHDDAVFIDEFSAPAVNAMLHEMHQEKIHAGIFLHHNLEALKKAFWKKFTIIKAGGGLVMNEKNEVLFIYRRGKWDLPKGKQDPGETIEACALREVEEETGVKNIALQQLLLTTYHTYNESGHHILKESYWYEMKVTGVQNTTPQTEEDIVDIKWVPLTSATALLPDSFPSIADVLHTYMNQKEARAGSKKNKHH